MLFGSKLAVKTDGALFRYKVSWSRIVEMEQKKKIYFSESAVAYATKQHRPFPPDDHCCLR